MRNQSQMEIRLGVPELFLLETTAAGAAKLEFRDQLKRSAVHRDDVMYLIIDKIKARVGGYLQIKGRR